MRSVFGIYLVLCFLVVVVVVKSVVVTVTKQQVQNSEPNVVALEVEKG